ncbi:hypothetical protein C5S36_05280 [Candidatus Methanophagaceae archaeon]|nr:hypothetical protein C5S36_05280 [Methanophagales archaeon]
MKTDPPSANVYFPAGLDDNPLDETTNSFNDTIDADGMRIYAVEFNDSGSYTIRVTDLDTDTYDSVDIAVIEKEVIFSVTSTVVLGDSFDIKGTANSGDTVTVAVEDEVVLKLYELVIDGNGEFRVVIDTNSADAPAAFKVPGSVRLKAYIGYEGGVGTVPQEVKDDGSVVILILSSNLNTSFDTGTGTYPSIAGTHNGTITPNVTINVSQLYTYPCEATGGRTEHVIIWNNSGFIAEAYWGGYHVNDGHNISFDGPFTLVANETYNYTIRTGSYPQIIHATNKDVTGGTITCDKFVDANGKKYTDWIPAIRFF